MTTPAVEANNTRPGTPPPSRPPRTDPPPNRPDRTDPPPPKKNALRVVAAWPVLLLVALLRGTA